MNLEKPVYFIENEKGEWYSFTFRGQHITSNNPYHVCGCVSCQNISQWTNDPLEATQFKTHEEAVEFIVLMEWLDAKVTEHIFL